MKILRLFLIGAFCAIVSLPLLAGGGEQSVYDADEESSETVSEETQNESLSGEQGTTQPSASAEQQAGAGAESSNGNSVDEQSSAQTQGQDGSTQGGGDKPSNGQNSNSKNTGGANKEAKNRETSLENRALSGASMAVTGLGAMQLAQGLAEQSADSDADAAMTAYLGGFRCNIGTNGPRKYKLGDVDIETPGANQLTQIYQEYVDLAADLKERKTALGMRPGIESEVVLDKAYTGLYNDVGTGANGTYASLYRAKIGSQVDQAKIDADREKSSQYVKGGAAAAAVGAIGGAVGNILINGDSAGGDDASLADKAASLFLGKSDNKSWKYLKVASIDVDKHCKLDGASVVNGIVSGDIMANCGDELKSNGCPENIEYFEKSGNCTGELASNAKKCKLCKELSQKSADCVQELDSYCKTQGVDRAKLLKQKMGI